MLNTVRFSYILMHKAHQYDNGVIEKMGKCFPIVKTQHYVKVKMGTQTLPRNKQAVSMCGQNSIYTK